MIQAKDLRIGNWIERKSGNYAQVENIYPDSVHVQCEPPLKSQKGMSIPLRAVSGIGLTPEKLAKCGFEPWMDIDENEMMRREDFFIEWMEFLSLDSGYYFNWQSPKETKITYLHELQNLYYALTGKELDFKP